MYCTFLFKEATTPYLALSDRHLQILWMEQRFSKPLLTADGTPLEILFPGHWNEKEGPSFLEARVRMGKTVRQGSIDVSCYPLQDDSLLLQVGFESFTTQSQNQLFLKPFLDFDVEAWMTSVDLDAYPYKKFEKQGRCSETIFPFLTDEEIVTFLPKSNSIRQDPEKTAYLKKRFFGDHPRGSLLDQAALLTGAYTLHKEYCLHYGEACIGCPFAKNRILLAKIEGNAELS